MGHHPSSERRTTEGRRGQGWGPNSVSKIPLDSTVPITQPPSSFSCFPDFQPFIYLQFPFMFSIPSWREAKEDKSKEQPHLSTSHHQSPQPLSFFLSQTLDQCGKVFQLSHPSACLNATLYPLFTNFSSVASFNSFPPHHPPHKQKLNTNPSCLYTLLSALFSALFF